MTPEQQESIRAIMQPVLAADSVTQMTERFRVSLDVGVPRETLIAAIVKSLWVGAGEFTQEEVAWMFAEAMVRLAERARHA